MLKLIKNRVPSGLINGSNKIYSAGDIIGVVDEIYVDGVKLTGGYEIDVDTITFTVAPATSVTISFFMREVTDIAGDGTVTFGDLVEDVYEEIGRKQYSKIYNVSRIIKELKKTILSLFNKSLAVRNQFYALRGLNGLTVTTQGNTVDTGYLEGLKLDIAGMFIVDKGAVYEYNEYDGTKFTVSGVDMIDDYDRIVVGHRVPYGVKKISEVIVNGYKLEYNDNSLYNIDDKRFYTIHRDRKNSQYIFLPYMDKEYDLVVKYIPDPAITSNYDDVIDIGYEHTRAIVYDVVYRLLSSRDDDRWERYFQFLKEEEKKYKQFISRATDKRRGKIGIYSDRVIYNNVNKDGVPIGIFDKYK